MRVESVPDNFASSCRNAPGSHGISATTQACAPPPSGAPDAACVPYRPTSPHQYDGYEERNPLLQRRCDRWGCHNLYRDKGAAALLRWVRVARRPRLREFLSATWNRGRWRLRWLQREDHPRLRRGDSSWYQVCLDPLGLAPFFALEPSLAEATVGGLPPPIDTLKLFTIGDQSRPQRFEDSVPNPSLKPTMHRTIVPEHFRQLVPLASRPHPKDDAVERPPQIGARPTGTCRWIQIVQQGFDQVPSFVRYLPHRLQRYVLNPFLACHPLFPLLLAAPDYLCRHQVQTTEGVLR